MKQCEYCGALSVTESGFCGSCGRVSSQIAHRPTRISDIASWRVDTNLEPGDDNQTILSASGKHMVPYVPGEALHPVNLVPLEEEFPNRRSSEDERRRAALLDVSAFVADADIAAAPTLGMPPGLSGTPLLGQAPVLPGGAPVFGQAPVLPGGAPAFGQAPVLPGGAPAMGGQAPVISGLPPQGGVPYGAGAPPLQNPPAWGNPPSPPYSPGSGGAQLGGSPGSSSTGTAGTTGGAHGCLTIGAILLAACLIILATTFGLGLTVFAPGLALNGSSTVSPGGALTLHGHNFLPNSSITLTLDNGTPLYSVLRPSAPVGPISYIRPLSATMLMVALPAVASGNTIAADGNGNFNTTVRLSSSLSPGGHTVHATEGVSHRSASLPFTVAQGSATPTDTPTAAPTDTPTDTPTPTATATPSPTPVPPALSCVTPANLALGPISELSSQTTSGTVTLCTGGSGPLTWTATWDQNQAGWLSIAQATGTVQAPNQFQTVISASAASLNAGTYTATVTFSATGSNVTESVNVTLTVKAGCASTAPQALRFAGVEGVSDPTAAQSVTLTNCGMTSDWSADIKNSSGWLSLGASKGTLKGGQSRSVSVKAANLASSLRAGTYQDSLVFTIGGDTSTVTVTLVVQPPPATISVNPTSMQEYDGNCTTHDNGATSLCTVTLTNNSSEASLVWTYSSNGRGVTVSAGSTTIPAGGTEQVVINIPTGNCGSTVTTTFSVSGGNSSAAVSWSCPVIG